MKSKISFIAFAFFALILGNSCFLTDECGDLNIEQLLKFGEYSLTIDSSADTLSLGDSIRFTLQMPNELYDSISQRPVEIEAVEVGFFVTRDTEEEKDTSLIYIFDQFFDIIVNKGELLDPYHFKLQKNNSTFELDFYYVCKKELKYYIPIQFDKIIAKNVDTACMMGDTETWGAKIGIDSEYNTIENQDELLNYFGFVVQ